MASSARGYPTPYTTFVRLHAETAAASGTVQPTGAGSDAPRQLANSARSDRPRKLSWKEQKELNSLEPLIEEMETTKTGLMAEMNECGDDYVRLQSLAEQMEKTDSALDIALERWLELSE